MTKTFQYRASLSDTTLPEMLETIRRLRVPGVIEASSGSVSKRVFLRDGYVIHASSTDLEDSLGVHLKRQGKISASDHRRLAAARERAERRFGVMLIEERLLTPAEVNEAIRSHVEEIVWSLFFWSDGTVSFSVGEFGERDMVQIQLPLRRVIFEGIKRAPEARPLVLRLGRRDTLYEPSFRWEQLIELALDEDDYSFLTAVDGRRTLYELCSLAPGSAGDNAKLLYAFSVLHLVRRVGDAENGRSRGVKVKLKVDDDTFGG